MSGIVIQKKNNVATITLNRPESKNAVTREMWVELLNGVNELAADNDVRCVVLTGAGDAFCAGGDVKDMVDRLNDKKPKTEEQNAAYIRQIVESARMLHEMPKPTIAAINGAAAGAGLSLALACDIRVAVNDAKMTTAFANVGLSGDFGGAWFLSQIIGAAKAKQLFFDPTPISGEKAKEIGIVNEVVPRDQFNEVVKALATQLANGPTKAFGFMKRNFALAESAPLGVYLNQEAMLMGLSFNSKDHSEAAKAFVEKRNPKFTGK